ncbi:EAL domain-containing response regulator [Rhizobium gallicum]|uniref:EAL domain-containing response regulator n=1 Tax=Rhizobium gallicum TaxID=56730 RepID=UPI001EF97A21|nr:EAL domain-containing response regulator [Rhizobium gallicum]ULJ74536.1 EAL domain-containing response regulator [Rhizobium gallicum]
MKAVLIDDDPEVCHLLQVQLQHIGVEARAVTTISDMLDAVRRENPDIVFVDLSLGDADGIDVFHMLRDVRFMGPVIIVSGHPEMVLRHAKDIAFRIGLDAKATLKKPFQLQDLRRVLNEATNGTSTIARVYKPGSDATLREALQKDWIEFWFQPQVDLKAGHIVGAECLARIRHPTAGLVFPGQFLPTGDDDDLHELTMRAADAAAKAASLDLRDGVPLRFSINVSTHSMKQPGLIFQLKRICADSAIDLTLEITESDRSDSSVCRAFATRAVLHGFKISIDDFGSGYATFERLRHTPFSELKLDRSVVNGCSGDRALRNICVATIQLAHGFNAHAVAEGVETPEDAATLAEIGCDIAQGYFFAPALPLEEFAAYVRFPKRILPRGNS